MVRSQRTKKTRWKDDETNLDKVAKFVGSMVPDLLCVVAIRRVNTREKHETRSVVVSIPIKIRIWAKIEKRREEEEEEEDKNLRFSIALTSPLRLRIDLSVMERFEAGTLSSSLKYSL